MLNFPGLTIGNPISWLLCFIDGDLILLLVSASSGKISHHVLSVPDLHLYFTERLWFFY